LSEEELEQSRDEAMVVEGELDHHHDQHEFSIVWHNITASVEKKGGGSEILTFHVVSENP
jgi:hypothetical protein